MINQKPGWVKFALPIGILLAVILTCCAVLLLISAVIAFLTPIRSVSQAATPAVSISTAVPPVPTITPTLTARPAFPTATRDPSPPAAGGLNLGRTFAKLAKENSLRIGYLGGSITAGEGASDASTSSYTALVSQWFRQQYPGAEISTINAGEGGTGAEFGAFRAYQQLGTADLVFIEFAINDGSTVRSELDQVTRYTEGIVRRLYKANPSMEIVFVDLADVDNSRAYQDGKLPPIVSIHRQIADHYTIAGQNSVLYVPAGDAMVKLINSGKASWVGGTNPMMSADGTHPNDAGHRYNAHRIIAALEQARSNSSALPAFIRLPAPLLARPVENGLLVDPIESSYNPSGWLYENQAFGKSFASQIHALTINSRLDYHFANSQYIGIALIQDTVGGSFEAWIDKGKPVRISTLGPFLRMEIEMLSNDLGPGEHVLHVRAKDLPVTILAFLVDPTTQ